ncbi:MAG TPA: PD-(D/E)XK nuclease family protein [Phycisphaerae bacterium]|mgnify:FL=1|nr:PD-(D/E)XK nuclease family protein [Phycisphaerae bacterium]HOQ84492.1 PD-(D/E)XK nuclease family protein [Phycisphaerae bacterium]HPZ99208.1 PD-(D/E)XK nuclease family protein [Phycisphaerae bacterium]HQE26188.1 PD-(D/E)XK nuclease family protein [Phycisphaerae bacterium]
MAVRFVVGRAGSGKTFRCLEAVRTRLRETAAEGPRLLLLVPEQASFQVERALIETPDIPAYTRCEVLSFQRLAYRVFAETGADPRRSDQTIGGLGRMMVIRRLIRRERVGLRLLGSVADKPGLVNQVAGTLDELMREEVDPAKLAEVAEAREEVDPLGAAKLADVARLYQAYLDYLIEDRIDPAQYLNLAAQRLDGCSFLSGAEVWVDGFAGFTRQEFHLLAEVAKRAAKVEITMLVDPAASAVEATQLPAISYSRFARAERTLVRLRTELQSRGVAIDEPIRLETNPERCRFAAPELLQLERELFIGGVASTTTPAQSPQAIRILEMPDRRTEVEAAVAEVQRLAATGMRYREMAIIVRDLAVYHDLISAAMRSRGIACFIDRRQPTTHHPLIELVRALLALAEDDCRLDSVRLTFKTGLLSMDMVDADLLENYLLAHGIAGWQRWSKEWEYTRFFQRRGENGELSAEQRAILSRVNELRRKWCQAMGPWIETAKRGTLDGRTWARELFACLDRLRVAEKLERWAQAAVEEGQPEAADMHRQVWTDFTELLDEFVRALGGESLRIDEFRETLEAALAEFNLGLAPATLDQVLVGQIERSRHPEIRAVLLLGFDEASYPLRRSEDPLLGDAEREALRQVNAEIGPSRNQKLADERMLAYIALTRASERLWISYPRQDADGKPLQASAYLQDVLTTVPGLRVEKVPGPEAGRAPAMISSVRQLGARLAREFRYRPRRDDDLDIESRASWNALYEAARARAEWSNDLARALGGLRYTNEVVADPARVARLIDEPLTMSVSRLESFAACPFRHFAASLLRLQERVEAETSRIDLGQLCHAILERFVFELAKEKKRLAELEDDEINERVDAIAQRTLPDMVLDLMLDDARSEFLCDRSRGHLSRVMRWQRDFARRGRFRPAAAEFPFGYRDRPDAVVRLRTPKGRDLLLRGRIDRVDVAELGDDLLGLVIDYKRTSHRRLDITQVYHGLALQLVGYLIALRQTGRSLAGREIRPVAALYLPLLEPFKTVAHPDEAENVKTYQCRGILDASVIEAIDEEVRPGSDGASRFLSAKLKSDGTPHSVCDLAEREEVSALMAHVERRMGELADAIADGEIAIRPYRLNRRMPCPFCPYRPVCRYEIETQPCRYLDSLRRKEVLEQLASEYEGKK